MPATDRTAKAEEPSYTSAPEDVVFDKAEKAESIERLREMYDEIGDEIDALKEQIDNAVLDKDRDALKSERARLKERRERLAEIIKKREKEKKE
jgi:regulator of replication initiation timing